MEHSSYQRLVRVVVFALVGLVGPVFLFGCRGDGNGNSGAAWTHRTTAPAEYYLVGPQQSTPPDGTLPAGVKVRILSKHGSYTRIATKTDLAGTLKAHVSSDVLEPLD